MFLLTLWTNWKHSRVSSTPPKLQEQKSMISGTICSVLRKVSESHQLPPCKDCLVNHALRANYHAGIWRRCLEQNPQVPSPVGRGWKIEKDGADERLVLHWIDGQPAPQAILDLLTCNCSKKCVLPNCECLANGLKCTDMCRLSDCENQALEANEESVDSLDDERKMTVNTSFNSVTRF